jgi:hypothetical protein
MTLQYTQFTIKMSTKNLPEGKRQVVRKVDKLAAICEMIIYEVDVPQRLVTGITLLYLLQYIKIY